MSHTPPVPAGNQSPFPLQEAPHTNSAAPAAASGDSQPAVIASAQQGVTAARDAIAPLATKATTFARERPYATAALVGTIALAVFNSLRGRRG
jgi:hypothetical protein